MIRPNAGTPSDSCHRNWTNINANACSNKFRWNAHKWTCIDGADIVEKQKKVCACCSCVEKVMCDWANSQNFC
ncbi:hypothetical protein EJ02DRAFT_453912 [Clathrospora elynae]|uniref:Uncharacterized protein n=1 Tax=Clathrospora elynae TaxID=706981 RepID=A0A6A5SQE2_9PLEO|nr:hypothetical protein EJ02DRAFT_453912 [Clathrospora elynae]